MERPPDKNEALFGQEAVRLGVVSPEQILAALDEQRLLERVGIKKRVGEILIERGVLSQEGLQEVLSRLRSGGVEPPRMQVSALDDAHIVLLGQLVVATGILSPERIDKCIEIGLALHEVGLDRNLGRILLDKGYVADSTLRALVEMGDTVARKAIDRLRIDPSPLLEPGMGTPPSDGEELAVVQIDAPVDDGLKSIRATIAQGINRALAEIAGRHGERRLGEMLVNSGILDEQRVLQALEMQEEEARRGSDMKLGEILLQKGWIDRGALEGLLALQKATRRVVRSRAAKAEKPDPLMARTRKMWSAILAALLVFTATLGILVRSVEPEEPQEAPSPAREVSAPTCAPERPDVFEEWMEARGRGRYRDLWVTPEKRRALETGEERRTEARDRREDLHASHRREALLERGFRFDPVGERWIFPEDRVPPEVAERLEASVFVHAEERGDHVEVSIELPWRQDVRLEVSLLDPVGAVLSTVPGASRNGSGRAEIPNIGCSLFPGIYEVQVRAILDEPGGPIVRTEGSAALSIGDPKKVLDERDRLRWALRTGGALCDEACRRLESPEGANGEEGAIEALCRRLSDLVTPPDAVFRYRAVPFAQTRRDLHRAVSLLDARDRASWQRARRQLQWLRVGLAAETFCRIPGDMEQEYAFARELLAEFSTRTGPGPGPFRPAHQRSVAERILSLSARADELCRFLETPGEPQLDDRKRFALNWLCAVAGDLLRLEVFASDDLDEGSVADLQGRFCELLSIWLEGPTPVRGERLEALRSWVDIMEESYLGPDAQATYLAEDRQEVRALFADLMKAREILQKASGLKQEEWEKGWFDARGTWLPRLRRAQARWRSLWGGRTIPPEARALEEAIGCLEELADVFLEKGPAFERDSEVDSLLRRMAALFGE